MARPKPPPRTLAPEDERKIQSFLERAAPIVLAQPVIDSPTWNRLAELAAELELDQDQLRATIEDLRQRGVIERIEIRPPQPPPLPHDPAQPADSSAPAESSPHPSGPGAAPEFDERFSLSAPPPLPRPPQRTRGTHPPQPTLPIPAAPGEADPAAGQNVERSLQERREQFRAQAERIIAEQRGLGPKSQALLAAAAADLGITDEELHEFLGGEPGRSADEPRRPAENIEDATSLRRRWREEGRPPPTPEPAKKRPSEVFREYVAQSLDKCSGGQVSAEVEARILKHATKVLKLARVYARHILADVAEARQLRLPSQPPLADEPALSAEQRLFRDRAASILAEHRGINAKSRILLSALAHELGFNDQETDAAIALLQNSSQAESPEVERQAERLAEFTRHAEMAMAKLPRGILLPNTNELLVEQGHERYGVEVDAAQAAVREIARATDLSVITAEQAATHLDQLVDQMLHGGVRVTPEIRERVMAEAAQWGVSPDSAERVIQSRTRRNYQRKRADQKLINVSLMAGACAVTLLAAFIGWSLLGDVSPVPVADPEEEVATRIREMRPREDQDNSWWSADLAIALAECRLEFASLRPTLEQVRSTDAERRAAAYEQLVEQAFDLTSGDRRRAILAAVLAQCYALDPDGGPADRLAAALLEPVPAPENPLSRDPEVYADAFWGLRTAVAALAEARIAVGTAASSRASELAIRISEGVGGHVDADQPRDELEAACLGALAENLFRLLIIAVETQPSIGPDLHRVIATEAVKYLERGRIDRFNADYLVALLRNAADAWTQHRELISRTINSVDPLAVVKLVGLFETTDNETLRAFMEPLLRSRTRIRPTPQEIPELAEAFRRSLGVRPDATRGGRQRILAQRAKSVLDSLQSGEDDPSKLLKELAQLAWLQSLACALVADETGLEVFRRLSETPPEIEGDLWPADATERRPTTLGDPVTQRRIRGFVGRLRSSSNMVARASQVEYLASLTDDVPDLTPFDARRLANYLLQLDPGPERDSALGHAPSLGKWKQLRLAVADRIDRNDVSAEWARELTEAMLRREFDETIPAARAKQEYRIALLQSALLDPGTAIRRPVSASPLDACRRELADQCRTQLELLGGVLPPSAAGLAPPSAIFPELISNEARRLRRGDLPRTLRAELEELPHRFAAIAYVARDDLHETTLLTRVWLEILRIRAANSGAAAEAEALLAQLQQEDQLETSSLLQLHRGYRAITQMWLLITGAEGSDRR